MTLGPPPPPLPPPPPPLPPPPSAPPPPAEPEWLRLSPRTMLVDPVKVLRQAAFPLLIALVGIGSGNVGLSLTLLPVALVATALFGLLPYLTTRYRVTATHLQVRTGVLHRTTSTAPLDRVRSVDLEASLLRRLLSLAVVKVGTGVDDDRVELDALDVGDAESLRAHLLAVRAATLAGAPTAAPAGTTTLPADGAPAAYDVPPPPAAPPPEVLATIDWGWLRFAPFSLARLVLLAGALGALSQVADDLPLEDWFGSAWDWALRQAVLPLVLGGVLVVGAVWLVVSVLGYVLQWWDLRLVRDDGTLRLTAGLLTTRSTSVEEARVRGVELVEPLLLRAVGGAELRTLATGVGTGGTTKVLPPSPRGVDVAVGHAVLGTPGPQGPLDVPLVRHPATARRRCWTRAVVPDALLVAGVAAAAAFTDLPAWVAVVAAAVLLPVGAVAAELSWRNLGHALTPDHLVAQAPTATRRRTVLELDGVIGWVVQQSWFQRRLGLATLVATTAAGPEKVVVVDVARDDAVALAARATPDLLAPFLAAR